MSRLIESIKLLDGRFYNLAYHEQRMSRSLQVLFAKKMEFKLESFLGGQEHPASGLHKCRILYNNVSMETTFSPYEPKIIRRLKTVAHDRISYAFKFQNRKMIDELFQQRGDCDDILIIKGGKVTDCSFSNIAFRKGNAWWTPSSALLKGTMRQKLIDNNYISEEEIMEKDIPSFDSCKIINAMLEFDSPEIAVSNIVF